MGRAYAKWAVERNHRCVLQVISLRFCCIRLRDKIRFAGSALSCDFEAERCEKWSFHGQVKCQSSLLPVLDFFLGYSKAPAEAEEQRLNLCVCPLWHKGGANTRHSVLDWYTLTRYALCHRGRLSLGTRICEHVERNHCFSNKILGFQRTYVAAFKLHFCQI